MVLILAQHWHKRGGGAGFCGLQAAPTLNRHNDAPCLLLVQVEQPVWGVRFPWEGTRRGADHWGAAGAKLKGTCTELRCVRFLGQDLPPLRFLPCWLSILLHYKETPI